MKIKLLVFLGIVPVLLSACNQKSPGKAEQALNLEKVIQAPELRKMIIARIYIKPGRETDFISAAKSLVESSNKESGCEFYQLYQNPYEKTNFTVVETYKNQAAVDAHFSMTYFKEFGPKISDITSRPIEIKILDICGEK
jgi:quinol monooxygenase YgiN